MAKRRRRSRVGIPVVIMLILVMLTMISVVAYWYINGDRLRLPGTWYRDIDITEDVKASMEEYLKGATLGNEVDTRLFIDKIVISSELVITKDGKMNESIDVNSYNEAKAKAQEAMKNAVSSLIATRIHQKFIDTDKSIDELVEETLGMNLSAYLEQFGPKLLPDYEELDKEYGMSADYEAGRETISISGQESEYAVAAGMLVIDYQNGAVVYHGKASEPVKVELEQINPEIVIDAEDKEGM